MSVNYVKQDITTITHGVIGHGTNCLGKMGSGIALAIRNKWPQVYTEYKNYCDVFDNPSEEMLGIVQIVDINNDLKVANCFTQVHCGHDGKKYANVNAIQEALEGVFAYADQYNLPIYLPKIGCGLGGLTYITDVQPIIEALATEFPHIPVTVCDI